MTGYAAASGCCCACAGDTWTCTHADGDPADIVEMVIKIKHTMKANRHLNYDGERCCPDVTTGNCSPVPGWKLKPVPGSGHPELEITYDAKVKVYMTPPSGGQTGDVTLGTWVQNTNLGCTSEWMANGDGTKGPRIKGYWKGKTRIDMPHPCTFQNCGSNDERRCEGEIDLAFDYETPQGASVPSNLVSMKKRKRMPWNFYDDDCNPGNNCCPGNVCLFDLLYQPSSVPMTMELGDQTFFARFITYLLTGDSSSECQFDVTPDNVQTYGASDLPTAPILFNASCRMAFDAFGQNTCSPPLPTLDKWAVDSGLALAWDNTMSAMNTPLSGTLDDALANDCFEAFNWGRGFQQSGTNGNQGNILFGPSGQFYILGQPFYPPVRCESGNLPDGRDCDVVNSAGKFVVPNNPCGKWIENKNNDYRDHIWAYDYVIDWYGITCETLCSDPDIGNPLHAALPSTFENIDVELKSELDVISVTPLHSADC